MPVRFVVVRGTPSLTVSVAFVTGAGNLGQAHRLVCPLGFKYDFRGAACDRGSEINSQPIQPASLCHSVEPFGLVYLKNYDGPLFGSRP
jgi:hypothetical protein